MPEVEFFGPSLRDSGNKWAESMRLVNMYREFNGARTTLRSVMGTEAFATAPGIFCRAMAVVGDWLYVAQGGTLYAISDSGAVNSRGAIVDGDTTISSNNGKVTVAANGTYYLLDGTTLTTPATGAFSDVGDVAFIGQLTVVSERDGRRLQWSDVADPATFDGLNFATAEARDDSILRLWTIGAELWVFKETSIERWYQESGGLAVIPGSARSPGLKSRALLVGIPNGAAFVGSDGRVYLVSGGLQPVSTIPVEQSIAADAPDRMIWYRDKGHEFICVGFPGRPAWCLDLATGEWHERAEGQDNPWSVRTMVEAFGGFYGGTDTGQVVRLARNGADVSGALIRRAVGTTIDSTDRFRVARLHIPCTVGTVDKGGPVLLGDTVLGADGDDEALGVDDLTVLRIEREDLSRVTAQIRLRISPDNGKTWGQPRFLSLGDIGDYDKLVTVRSLGQFRKFTPEIVYAEAADISFDAALDVEVA